LLVDAQTYTQRQKLKTRLSPYNINDPVFKPNKKLFAELRKTDDGKPDGELINSKNLLLSKDGNSLAYGGLYYQVDPFLSLDIYKELLGYAERENIYIRLDPTITGFRKPKSFLTEEIIRKANNSWWKSLNLHIRQRDGGRYDLQSDFSDPQNLLKINDFFVKKIRRLEVVASRKKPDYLSMMIEELSEREISAGYLIGRCIHLDTKFPQGSSVESVVLSHLDLSINIYEGERIAERHASDLSSGRPITDATYRTHILRVENIKMPNLIWIAEKFLESKYLFNEWCQDQFGI
jgi:hypothetical protein